MTKNTKLIKIIVIVAFCLAFAMPSLSLNALTKDTIEFKSGIIDQDGTPLTDGNYNFGFIIFNQATGGSALWSENWSGLQVRRGQISVDLGAITPFPKTLFKNDSLYLQVCLDANEITGDGVGSCGGNYEENFSPRKVITQVPWAYRANTLGPVTIAKDETAYNIDTYGEEGTLMNLNFNDTNEFSVTSAGNLSLGNGTNTFLFSPASNTINLTGSTDIFFGTNTSLKNNSSSANAGANIIGAYTTGLKYVSGNTVQKVIESIDGLFKWAPGASSSISYTGGNVGIGTTTPNYLLDVNGTGSFSGGLKIGNTTTALAGMLRWTGSDFQGYDGSSWVSLTSAGGGSPSGSDGYLQFYNSGSFGSSANLNWNIANNYLTIGSTAGNSGLLNLSPATTSRSSLNIASSTGTNVSSPASGDLWWNGTNLYFNNGSLNIDLLAAAGGSCATCFHQGGDTFGATAILGTADTQNFNLITDNTTRLAVDSAGLFTVTPGNIGDSQYGINITTNNDTSATTLGGGGILSTLNITSGTYSTSTKGIQSLANYNSSGTSSGSLSAFYGTTTISSGTLNGSANGIVVSTTNNSVVTNFMFGSQITALNFGTAGLVTGGRFSSQNIDGTATSVQGVTSAPFNSGTTDVMNGYAVLTLNATQSNTVDGVITGNMAGYFSSMNNAGEVQGDMYGGYFINAGTGTASNIYGLRVLDLSAQTVSGNAYGVMIQASGSNTVAGSNYGIYIDDVSGATTNNYSIYSAGGDAFLTNGLHIGNTSTATAGNIRWTGTDFEGYDGSSWLSLTASGGGGGGSPAGSNGDLQFYNSGSFGASSNLNWNNASGYLIVGASAGTSGILNAGPATTSRSSLNIASSSGTDVSSPTSGDLWWNGTNLYFYNGSTNEDLLAAGGGSSPWSTDANGIVYNSGGRVAINNQFNSTTSSDVKGLEVVITNQDGTINSAGLRALTAQAFNNGSGVASYMDGVFGSVVGDGTVNGSVYGMRSWIDSGMTITGNIEGLHIEYVSNSNTVDNAYGINIAGVGDGAVNNYGVYIGDVSGGSTNNYSIYSAGGDAFLTNGLHIGNTSNTTAGNIRWTGSDFEGYDGSTWNSLTSGGGGGCATCFHQSGDAFGATAVLGATDFNELSLIANNTEGIHIYTDGSTEIYHFTQFDSYMNIASVSDPGIPQQGDFWYNGTNLYFNDGSNNIDLLAGGGGGSSPWTNYHDGDFDQDGITYDGIVYIADTNYDDPVAHQGSLRIDSNNYGNLTSNQSALQSRLFNFDGATSNYIINSDVSIINYGTINEGLTISNMTMENSGSGVTGYMTGSRVWLTGDGTVNGDVAGQVLQMEGSMSIGGSLTGTRYNFGNTNSVDTAFGIYMDTMNAVGQINQYGLFIADVVNSSGDNYAIYTNAGDVHFGGNVNIGGTCTDSNGGDGGNDGCDVAETFSSNQNLQPGDVIKLDSSAGAGWKDIIKTTSSSDQVIGVISTSPTIVMGNKAFSGSNAYPVGLTGVLPTKVIDEKGMIHKGDLVTVSNTAGRGMKASAGDSTIGIAMEDQTSSLDTINVLISRNNAAQPVSSGATMDSALLGFTQKLQGLLNINDSTVTLAGIFEADAIRTKSLEITSDKVGQVSIGIGTSQTTQSIDGLASTAKVLLTPISEIPSGYQYWVEVQDGQFVVHTNQPVNDSDLKFNYLVVD